MDESFVILGSWPDSPAVVEKPVSYTLTEVQPLPGSSAMGDYGNRPPPPPSPYGQRGVMAAVKQPRREEERIFVTKMRLKEPLNENTHGGKYVLMTASLNDVRNMDYSVLYITINQGKLSRYQS